MVHTTDHHLEADKLLCNTSVAVTMENLEPNTTYSCSVQVMDKDGRLIHSEKSWTSFTTLVLGESLSQCK